LEAGRSGLRDEGGRGGDGGAGGRHGGDGAEVGAGAVPSQFEPQVAAPPVVVPQVRVGLHVGVPVGRPLHAVPPAGHGGAGELGAQGGGVGVVEVVLMSRAYATWTSPVRTSQLPAPAASAPPTTRWRLAR